MRLQSLMPHFFQMNEENMTLVDAYLLRSRLHIRAWRILLENRKYVHAIATIYDAVDYAMRWYYIIQISDTLNVHHNKLLYDAILEIGLSSEFDFYEFEEFVEESLDKDDNELNLDTYQLQNDINQFLTELGVLPFDFSELPPINEKTREIMGI